MRPRILCWLAIGFEVALLGCAPIARRAATLEFYVSPAGRSSGDGSRDRPWDLQTALAQTNSTVPPGSTIWLRGGTYAGRFVSHIAGTAKDPIIVRGYPGEWATVDGNVDVEIPTGRSAARMRSQTEIIHADGAYTWFWGFEITSSSPQRAAQSGERGTGLNLRGPGYKVINMVVHDVGHPGIGFWEQVGDGGEIYGSLIWGNGLYDQAGTWTRGSGTYAQNRLGTRFITNNIWFRNFTTGINLYTEDGYADGFDVEGNIAFDNSIDDIWGTGGSHPMQRLRIVGNYTYRKPSTTAAAARFGYTSDQGDAVIRDNYFASGRGTGLGLNRFAAAEVVNNTFVLHPLTSAGNDPKFAHVVLPAGVDPDDYTWDGNTYYDPMASPEAKTYFFGFSDGVTEIGNALGGGQLTFDETPTKFGKGWRQWTGWDARGTYVYGLPPNKVIVQQNKYEPGRAHIAIYNWRRQATVSIDLSSSGLKAGDTFTIRDAQNYFGPPVISGTYQGELVEIPMMRLTAAKLTGVVIHVDQSHTAPEFGAFVLSRTESPSGSN